MLPEPVRKLESLNEGETITIDCVCSKFKDYEFKNKITKNDKNIFVFEKEGKIIKLQYNPNKFKCLYAEVSNDKNEHTVLNLNYIN